MFKVGGVNSPQFQCLTSFVCVKQIDTITDTDTDVSYNNQYKLSI